MATTPVVNGDFETGDLTGWTAPAGVTVVVDGSQATYTGVYACNFTAGTPGIVDLVQTDGTPVWAGLKINASCWWRQGAASSGKNTGQIVMKWYDASDAFIGEALGNIVKSSNGNSITSVQGTVPSNGVFVRLGIRINKNDGHNCGCDSFTWDLNSSALVDLTFPAAGSIYAEGDSIPFRVEITTLMPITSVKYIATDVSTATETEIGTSTTAPYSLNYSALPAASYTAKATVTFVGGYTLDSDSQAFVVGAPAPPDTREYKASNAYAYLVGSNISNIGGAIPSTARVVGVKAIVDYSIKALIRSKDKGVTDPTVARYAAAFSMVPSFTFEIGLLDNTSGGYTEVGTNITAEESIESSDYLLQEDGTSGNKRWTILQGDAKTVEIGGDDSFFGQQFMAASDFFNKSLGIRCYPNLSPIPSYADSGDACFRVALDKFRLQVYFDPGSVEYYFVSPDETMVIKGRLVHYCVDDGDFRTGDASGTLQLEYDLEVIDGDQTYIGTDWTIHSEYPPTDANRIGDVAPTSIEPGFVDDPDDEDDAPISTGMEYNGLPTQQQVMDNGSRYEFITHNFYGDKDWDAVYGVNGYDKAFSFNGEWFYKICTNPDMDKDKPRHVAAHHQHLALGFPEGRVDISVVGQPYNYSGLLGASSWAIGDTVTGLLPLSGTILGVFGGKSIWGISGTTVDNFSTQVLAPNIGAIEYTVIDMGYPVHANAYGIYTLAQTQQYGDYLGTPMSVDVSPWLRPRLVRSLDSTDGVVAAWPVRSKNQYRLSFKDGMVLTMTINAGNQQAPTFSQQKYTLED